MKIERVLARIFHPPIPYGQQPRVNVTSNLQEVREKQAEAVMASGPERDEIWQMIDRSEPPPNAP